MVIVWNVVAMVRVWNDHDNEMTKIIVWSYYDHSMVSMVGQPGQRASYYQIYLFLHVKNF